MIFLLKARHCKQLLCYSAPSAAYKPLHYAQALQTDCLTLMLPSAIALEVTSHLSPAIGMWQGFWTLGWPSCHNVVDNIRALCCCQILRLQPQGCCLNDLSFKDPWQGRPEPQTAAALWDDYQRQQVLGVTVHVWLAPQNEQRAICMCVQLRSWLQKRLPGPGCIPGHALHASARRQQLAGHWPQPLHFWTPTPRYGAAGHWIPGTLHYSLARSCS